MKEGGRGRQPSTKEKPLGLASLGLDSNMQNIGGVGRNIKMRIRRKKYPGCGVTLTLSMEGERARRGD